MLSPENDAKEVIRALLDEYEQFLSGSGKAEGTIEAYLRTVRHLIAWVAQLPDNEGQFHPQQLTKTAVELYLTYLEQESFSLNHRTRVKSTIKASSSWWLPLRPRPDTATPWVLPRP